MNNKNEAVRMCDALGGSMGMFSTIKGMKHSETYCPNTLEDYWVTGCQFLKTETDGLMPRKIW